MNTQLSLLAETPAPAGRQVMNGKPVFTREAKSVINFESHFKEKLLCEGPTFSAGDACVYKCAFCYVPDLVRKLRTIPQMAHVQGKHEDIVIRRQSAAGIARQQLTDRHGRPKFKTTEDRRVIYASPLVDVAGNMELVKETVEICRVILELTNWNIRLLSKSNLLPKVAQLLSTENHAEATQRRMIFGVSTGTLDDGLARVFEEGTPLVSKRIQSLHWLQDNGFRTFGMVCPSLPQANYKQFAREMATAIRADRCEHVWAEVMNLRGESFSRTENALRAAKFGHEADLLRAVTENKDAWELYARHTFDGHAGVLPAGKLRFLQYVTVGSRAWWTARASKGAVVLSSK